METEAGENLTRLCGASEPRSVDPYLEPSPGHLLTCPGSVLSSTPQRRLWFSLSCQHRAFHGFVGVGHIFFSSSFLQTVASSHLHYQYFLELIPYPYPYQDILKPE